jgi:hypothetical protein
MTQPRKGVKYVREFAALVRDALPTWREIEGEPDARLRKQAERKRDIAIDELVTIYRDHKKRGQLDKLPPIVRIFCEQLKHQGCGKLPARKGGRPPDEHKKLLIAAEVAEALATGKRVKQAVWHVHEAFVFKGKRCEVPEKTIRDYYYDCMRNDRRALEVSLAWRRVPNTEPVAEPEHPLRPNRVRLGR